MDVYSAAFGKPAILGDTDTAIVAPMTHTADFDAFIDQAWDEHATAPEQVADRLAAEGARWVTDATRLAPLVRLVHHLHGEHLGRWQAGRDLIAALAAQPACVGDADAAAAAHRAIASLELSAGHVDALKHLNAADRIRVAAMAAANLAERDTARATQLFEQALAEAATGAWPAGDHVHRALAVSGNNLAASLEDKAERSADERALMITAATAARTHWAQAGGWLEVGRAEYRLAMTWLKAGDSARAMSHAQTAQTIVEANDAPAMEAFFAWEATARAAKAAANASMHQRAVAQARVHFQQMDAAGQQACAETLQALDFAAAPGH